MYFSHSQHTSRFGEHHGHAEPSHGDLQPLGQGLVELSGYAGPQEYGFDDPDYLSIFEAQNISVLDRRFMPGDYVQVAKQQGQDPLLNQVGRVVAIHQSLGVRFEAVHRQDADLAWVPHEHVDMGQDGWIQSQVVCYDSWVGQVDSWEAETTIGFDDGSVCTIRPQDEQRLQIESDEFDDVTAGCPVRAPAQVLRSAKWMKGSYSRRKHKVGTCIGARAANIMVSWQQSLAPTEAGPPPPVIPVNDPKLQRLTYRDPRGMCWTYGAPGLLTPSGVAAAYRVKARKDAGADAGAVAGASPAGSGPAVASGASASSPAGEDQLGAEDSGSDSDASREAGGTMDLPEFPVAFDRRSAAVLVHQVKSEVDVVWSDGTMSKVVPAVLLALLPEYMMGDQTLLPGDYVQPREESSEDGGARKSRLGVVQSCNEAKRTVQVYWMPAPADAPEYRIKDDVGKKLAAFEKELEIGSFAGGMDPLERTTAGGADAEESMYDLVLCRTLNFRVSDVVARLGGDEDSCRSAGGKQIDADAPGHGMDPSSGAGDSEARQVSASSSGGDGSDGLRGDASSGGSSQRVIFGEVRRTCADGMLLVCWSDGSYSKTHPFQLHNLGDQGDAPVGDPKEASPGSAASAQLITIDVDGSDPERARAAVEAALQQAGAQLSQEQAAQISDSMVRIYGMQRDGTSEAMSLPGGSASAAAGAGIRMPLVRPPQLGTSRAGPTTGGAEDSSPASGSRQSTEGNAGRLLDASLPECLKYAHSEDDKQHASVASRMLQAGVLSAEGLTAVFALGQRSGIAATRSEYAPDGKGGDPADSASDSLASVRTLLEELLGESAKGGSESSDDGKAGNYQTGDLLPPQPQTSSAAASGSGSVADPCERSSAHPLVDLGVAFRDGASSGSASVGAVFAEGVSNGSDAAGSIASPTGTHEHGMTMQAALREIRACSGFGDSQLLALDKIPGDFHAGGMESGGPPLWRSHSMRTASSNPRFARAVKRELQILRSELPPGVYACHYAEDIALLRLAIAGPACSPCAHVLHFFDVLMSPVDFPSRPPFVHFRSFSGERGHPNLYEQGSGKVCLSLLGTWETGEGEGSTGEGWQPGKSSMLQVAVSLQGLLLGSRLPYFSEPGLEGCEDMPGHTRYALLYNENSVVVAVTQAIGALRKPPGGMEALVRAHYAVHGARLLGMLQGLLALTRETIVGDGAGGGVGSSDAAAGATASEGKSEGEAAGASLLGASATVEGAWPSGREPASAAEDAAALGAILPRPPTQGFARVLQRQSDKLRAALIDAGCLRPPPVE